MRVGRGPFWMGESTGVEGDGEELRGLEVPVFRPRAFARARRPAAFGTSPAASRLKRPAEAVQPYREHPQTSQPLDGLPNDDQTAICASDVGPVGDDGPGADRFCAIADRRQ